MINIKISLGSLRMPSPRKSGALGFCPLKMAKKLIEQLEDSDTEKSKKAWKKLKCLYEKYSKELPEGPKREEFLKLVTPAIRQNAQYDKDGVELTTDHLSEG